MSGEQRVGVAVAGHVATVTLTRADTHNALDVPMFEQLIAAADGLATTAGVRAVVLHGDGPSFCSGLDVVSIMAAGNGLDGLVERVRGDVPNWFQRAAHAWLELPMPVIAALHGTCFGGGLQIALGADIRIAAPATLPRLVGIDVAKELTFTGRVFTGDEAARLGVITRLADDPLAAARELAAEIAGRSPDAVRAAKRLYDESWTGDAQRTLALEAELQLGLIGSPNQLAAVAAGFSKEPAEFVDP
jgi:enoyl-CoA hydratase/carnithine racemase